MTRRRGTPRAARLSVALLTVLAGACVQAAYDRTVLYVVDVSKVADVRTVGVRGGDQPLSWSADRVLVPHPDSAGLYVGAVTYRTGYLFTEMKFTVNGALELDGADNRRVRLARTTTGGDTTIYRAVFDER